jgi:PhnB protein
MTKMKLATLLNFGGNCEEAFRFYEQHLGGEITAMQKVAGQPIPPGAPEGWSEKVLHARMKLGEAELRGNDVPPGRFERIRSVYLALDVESVEEAERVWALLAEGGEVYWAMARTFFARRFGILRDRFGTSWMIMCDGAD